MASEAKTPIAVGDDVLVFNANARYSAQQPQGKPGKVVRVGRKLADIQYAHGTYTFRLDTGNVNDSYGHQYFRTLEQAAADQLVRSAKQTLSAHRVTLEPGNRFTGEQVVALADLVRDMTSDNQPGTEQ